MKKIKPDTVYFTKSYHSQKEDYYDQERGYHYCDFYIQAPRKFEGKKLFRRIRVSHMHRPNKVSFSSSRSQCGKFRKHIKWNISTNISMYCSGKPLKKQAKTLFDKIYEMTPKTKKRSSFSIESTKCPDKKSPYTVLETILELKDKK